jgi:hypothetical protein
MQSAAGDSAGLQGLWSGFWGGLVEPDGVVHQPVQAELFIHGDHVQWTGFPGLSTLTGTIRIEADTKQVRVTPAAEPGGPQAHEMVFAYQSEGVHLTLTDGDKRSIVLTQVRVNPLAAVNIEFVAATGMNGGGEVIVTEFEVHRGGRPEPTPNAVARRPLSMKQADVFVTQEDGLKKVSAGDVRRLICGSTPLVVAYRPDDRPSVPPRGQWQETDSEAVGRTIGHALRPGTLLFVVPESARTVPPP